MAYQRMNLMTASSDDIRGTHRRAARSRARNRRGLPRDPLRFLGLFVLVVAGVVIGACAPADAPATPLGEDRFAVLEADGDVGTMVEQHQAMMDQMRASATPQMLELMNNDPMWQMMRSGEYLRLLEEHEANIDRMLARGG